MKKIVLAAALPLLAFPAFADTPAEGARLALLSFESIDDSGRGYVDMGQMEEMRGDIFVSMDANDDGKMSEDEFLGWDFGYREVAEEADKVLAYETALKVVYSFWDRNADGEVTNVEHRKAVISDINRADLNGNAVLEKSEYLGGFSVLVAIRAALKP